jgi:hypothetical protein
MQGRTRRINLFDAVDVGNFFVMEIVEEVSIFVRIMEVGERVQKRQKVIWFP